MRHKFVRFLPLILPASLNFLLTISGAGNWLIGIANFFLQLIFNKRQPSDTLFLTVKEGFFGKTNTPVENQLWITIFIGPKSDHCLAL